ncbi:hypothetical protein [Actinokineospora spheciospongiae]|uniref:hypothetical protein n=1 Tax=Actinokineospora spheciospongiae TaxID=909613 RepID=UPI001268B5E6|nr:hypothetical protein [Actinokineospora spheciospongiae]
MGVFGGVRASLCVDQSVKFFPSAGWLRLLSRWPNTSQSSMVVQECSTIYFFFVDLPFVAVCNGAGESNDPCWYWMKFDRWHTEIEMQMLYAVDFDISCVENIDPVLAYSKLIEHFHAWLTWGASDCPLLADLNGSGEAEYFKSGLESKQASLRKVAWKVTGADDRHAFRVDVRQPLLAEKTWFQTRVTVSRNFDEVQLRVVMGRDITTGWLSPVPFDALRRPRLIFNVVKDSTLVVRVLGQSVDNDHISIKEPSQLEQLVNAINNSNRLPILVVSPSGDHAHGLAQRAARELQGLARVVTLRPYLSQKFNQLVPSGSVPFGGARLLWPDLSLRQPQFSADDLRRHEVSHTVQQFMRLLAPMSVIARGRDKGWEIALASDRAWRAQVVRQRLDEARAQGDGLAEMKVLTETLEQKQAELAEWETFNGQLLVENEQLKGKLQLTEDYRSQFEYWKSEYFRVASESKSSTENDWNSAPSCSSGDIDELLEYLREASEGALNYTENSVKSWENSRYPYPDSMREALISLAQASVEYRAKAGQLGKRLEDWIEEGYSLRVAMSDKGLTRQGLEKFPFEDETYSRIPHVKLDDHTTPDRVGRIYFALDSRRTRFIVDHIGLKLYGL